jgi:hypothetical protein
MTGVRWPAWLATLCACACAGNTIAPDQPLVATNARIAPYEFHDVCAVLLLDDRVDYRFDASEPVAFSIGYIEDGAALLPWSRDYMKADSGIFPVRYPQRYCLKWQAGPAGALLSYTVIIHRREP